MTMKEFQEASEYHPSYFVDYGPEKNKCKSCGGSVFRSLVWNSEKTGKWIQRRKGWGPFFCFNWCGHLNEDFEPVALFEDD